MSDKSEAVSFCCSITETCAAAVTEDIIKATADIMVDSGLQKAGYQYLVIDGNIPGCTLWDQAYKEVHCIVGSFCKDDILVALFGNKHVGLVCRWMVLAG